MKHSRRVDLECTCDKNRIKKNWRDSKQWRLQETRTIVLETEYLKIYCLKNSLRPHDGNRIEREDNCSEDQVGDGHEDDQDCRWVPEHSGCQHPIVTSSSLGSMVVETFSVSYRSKERRWWRHWGLIQHRRSQKRRCPRGVGEPRRSLRLESVLFNEFLKSKRCRKNWCKKIAQLS